MSGLDNLHVVHVRILQEVEVLNSGNEGSKFRRFRNRRE